MESQETPLEKNTDVELRSRELGSQRYLEAQRKLVKAGELSRTDAAGQAMRVFLAPAAESLTQWLETSQPGRNHASKKYLREVDPYAAIAIAWKTMLDAACRGADTTETLVSIGARVEDQARLDAFSRVGEIVDDRGNKTTGAKVLEYAKRSLRERMTSDYSFSRESLNGHIRRFEEFHWDSWSVLTRCRVGEMLFKILNDEVGMCVLETIRTSKNKSRSKVHLDEDFAAVFDANTDRRAAGACYYMPLPEVPEDWTTPFDGGYADPVLHTALVKKATQDHLKYLASRDLTPVYTAINALQRTRWCVNTAVLEVMEDLQATGKAVAGLIGTRDCYVPPQRDDIEDPEELRAYKAERAEGFKQASRAKSTQLLQMRLVEMAKMYGEQHFHYVYQLDSRGRVYPMTSDLSPQGCDQARGLLQFGEAKPIGTQQAVGWHAIYGAGLYGEDKCSLEDRVSWVEAQEPLIRETFEDPMSTLHWWGRADKPWQFLAWCFDWYGILEDGLEHRSAFPVQVDGTCNGLQIYSLLLRDREAGEAVNLTASEEPKDIYSIVAHATGDMVERIANSDHEDAELAAQWMGMPVRDRSVAKRPCMTLPYGVTPSSVRKFVCEAITKKVGKAHPWGDSRGLYTASSWLGGVVWEAMTETLTAAPAAKEWLRDICRATEGGPIRWSVPTGFVCEQAYPSWDTRKIDLHIGGKLKLTIAEGQSGIDKRRQANGIAPNYVHSLDAAALMLTIQRCLEDHGISSYSMIHDSYGTHAADIPVLGDVLREVFADIFTDDLLDRFLVEQREAYPDAEDMPTETPAYGDLDPRELLESDYFFS